MTVNRRTRVLLLFPDQGALTRVAPFLSRATMEITRAASANEAVEAAKDKRFDLALLSSPLPDMLAGDFIKRLRIACGLERPLPIVVMTKDRTLAADQLAGQPNVSIIDLDEPDEVLRNVIAEALGVAARLAVRIPVRLEVGVATGQTYRFCETRNISSTGILISSSRPLPLGAHFRFQLTLPYTYTPLSGRAEVVRQTDQRREQTTGFGARILELSEGDSERLETFIRQEISSRASQLEGGEEVPGRPPSTG